MKTTIDVADALLEEARVVAARERTTLRALIEEGLRHVLRQRAQATPFHLRDESFGEEGLQGAFQSADWDTIRDAAYEGRGT